MFNSTPDYKKSLWCKSPRLQEKRDRENDSPYCSTVNTLKMLLDLEKKLERDM